MAKKEISIFSLSFLDLLSGALGAVIILFIIVPKMDSSDSEALEVIDSLNVEVNNIAEILEQAQNSIPTEVYEALQESIEQIEAQNEALAEIVEQTERELQNANQRNRQYEQQLVEAEHRIEELEHQLQQLEGGASAEQVRRLQEQLSEARSQMEGNRQQAAQGASGPGASMFGVNAKFAVVCDWNEDADIDLYLKKKGQNKFIYYQNVTEDFGMYLGDVQSRRPEDGKFEMIYQADNIVQGVYEVWYHVYSRGASANINGYAVFMPFTNQEIKIKFDNILLHHSSAKPQQGGGRKIAEIKLSANNLTKLQ